MITLHARVNEVNVLFIATDKHGKFVRDLTRTTSTFSTTTSRRRRFSTSAAKPIFRLHIGLLVDVSGSVDGRFDFEQNAATSFLQHTLRDRLRQSFCVGFNSHSQMAQDFTDNV